MQEKENMKKTKAKPRNNDNKPSIISLQREDNIMKPQNKNWMLQKKNVQGTKRTLLGIKNTVNRKF